MFTFLLWCILFVLCWPLAILALVLYPIVWLILLPFRIVGIAVVLLQLAVIVAGFGFVYWFNAIGGSDVERRSGSRKSAGC